MTKRLAAAAATALLLTLTACGGGDGDGEAGGASGSDDAKASKSIADSIMKGQAETAEASGGMFQMKREEADCIGEGFVDKIGTEQLQEYGFLTKDLKTSKQLTQIKMNAEDAEAAAGTLFDCTDVQAMMSQALAAQGNIDPKTQKCLEDALTEDALREMFTLLFSGKQEEANQAVVAPMMKCAAPGASPSQ
jgi:hypothetical protein